MKRYGMFTNEGNAMIHGMVMTAKVAKMNWQQVYDLLYDIGTLDGFEEATDTEVREAVYCDLENFFGKSYE